MATLDRRRFITQSAATLAAGTLASNGLQAATSRDTTLPRRGLPIAVSTYSFWRFKENM
jgi:hypothetical protein